MLGCRGGRTRGAGEGRGSRGLGLREGSKGFSGEGGRRSEGGRGGREDRSDKHTSELEESSKETRHEKNEERVRPGICRERLGGVKDDAHWETSDLMIKEFFRCQPDRTVKMGGPGDVRASMALFTRVSTSLRTSTSSSSSQYPGITPVMSTI